MRETYNRTINTLQRLRAISEHSLYGGQMTSRARTSAPRRTDDTEKQVDIWARRAARANGFGGM